MTEAAVIFPHQLFRKNPVLTAGRKVYLVEEFLFFRQYDFHRQKLILHRASMKQYQALLEKNGYEVEYIEAEDQHSDIRMLISGFTKKNVETLYCCDPADDWLHRRIISSCKAAKCAVIFYETPGFINSVEEGNEYFSTHRHFQTEFYIFQRKKRNILLNNDGGPLGGKWSFDHENRKRFPQKTTSPAVQSISQNLFVEEAIKYVNAGFPNAYGSAENFTWPTNYKQAEQWLQAFFETRFREFGIYEDAMVAAEHHLHHSALSALINIGLLLPNEIVAKAIEYAEKNNIPINSTEGFVRQIAGWREYIRIVYMREGRRQRTKNFWHFSRKIPKTFWTGNTGIEPIDAVIKKVLKTGYCHHIERLMVLGNFMLLCEFDPDEVYRWFMEMFIDSYDWVMVPNVYGMVQFADGGIMTTKPYISSSNYILKMSDFKKGGWSEIWDALFWRFMIVHRNVLEQNLRWKMLFGTLDKKTLKAKNDLLDQAESFLSGLQ